MSYYIYIDNAGVQTVLKGPYETVSAAKLTQAANAIDSLSITLPYGHPAYSRMIPFATAVKVIDTSDGSVVFDGRVLDPVPSMSLDGGVSRQIECESVEAYLNDSIQPYLAERQWAGDASRTGLQQYIDAVLANHNAKVETHKRIYRGVVDAKTHETNNSVYKGLQREHTYDALKKKLVDVFGGEMRVRRDASGVLRLDYRAALGSLQQSVIERGVNMKEASRALSYSDVVTRLTPLGKKLDDSDDRLTIASVNGGKDYIDDPELIKAYGIVEGTETWDDVEVPANLLKKAREYLAQKRKVPESVRVSAIDLSLVGLAPEAVRIYDSYRCKNDLIELDAALEVVKVTVDLCNPINSTYELGARAVSQTQQILQAKNAAAKAESRVGSVSPISQEWMRQNLKSCRKVTGDGA